jgi:hypothetical protein
MTPIPPIAPDMGGGEAEESAETPEVEQSETKLEVKCAAKDCKFNKMGYCSKSEINVSAGPSPKCESYEPSGGGGMKPPAPPLPFKAPMMGGM